MKVLGDRILMDPIEPPEGVIATPGLSKTKTPYGRVSIIGDGPNIPKDLQVGQLVRVDTNYGHAEAPYDGRPHRIVSTKDIQLILGDDFFAAKPQ